MRVQLFFDPYLIYGGGLVLAARRRMAVPRGPVPWVVAGVAGLMLVALAWFGTRGAPPGAHYVPPHEAGGRIVPGHFDKAPP
jgi:hypothetical protein